MGQATSCRIPQPRQAASSAVTGNAALGFAALLAAATHLIAPEMQRAHAVPVLFPRVSKPHIKAAAWRPCPGKNSRSTGDALWRGSATSGQCQQPQAAEYKRGSPAFPPYVGPHLLLPRTSLQILAPNSFLTQRLPGRVKLP